MPVRLALVACVVAGMVSPRIGARDVSAVEPVTRTVYVSVIDNKGAAIGDLTPADFVVKEGGKPYEVIGAPIATTPMQIALVIDDNGTGVFRGVAASFVNALLARAEFSIVSVVGRLTTLTELTNSPDKLRDAIGGLNQRSGAQDGAYLLDGILEAVKSLEKRQAARPVVVALTVGASDKSGSGPGEILKQLKQTMASLQVISIGNALVSSASQGGKVGDLIEQNGNVNQTLDEGPKQSGGRRVGASTMPEVMTAIGQLSDQLLHQYAVSYRLPDGVKPNERFQVTVKRSGATVVAPTKIADR